MAVQGAFTFFNLAKLKVMNGGGSINLASDTFKAVLCNATQALSSTFAGTSGNAQYSDLTGELATLNGYTQGGTALTGVTLTESGPTVTWNANAATWTITGNGIQFKYFVIYDNTLGTKDLVVFANMDTSSTTGQVTSLSGPLTIAISGIETLT